jgi:hypothetical protein
VSEVAAWVESRNNVSAAARHFIARMISEAATYAALSPTQRYTRAESWLDDAVVNQDFLMRRLAGQLETNPTYAPADDWLEHVREYT